MMSKILIIEDDPTTRLILQADLELEGYKVTVADNGKNGLEKAQQINPAVIISDWMMPLMNGIELCRKIKTDQKLAITSFILLTSRSSLEDLVQALDAGADEFLSKPVEPHELHARVRSAIRQYELKRMLNVTNQQLNRALQELKKDQVIQFLNDEINKIVQSVTQKLYFTNEQLQSLLILIELYQKYYPQPHPEIQQQLVRIKLTQPESLQLFNSLKQEVTSISQILNSKMDSSG